jgi:uncharacterized protein with GYD domain
MTTYYLFGTYTNEALENISAERTEKCRDVIEKYGGEIILMHALLGEYDLVFIINFPDNEAAMKASIALNKLTGISFMTSPAVTVARFDEIVKAM